jgi:hypothetical protein
MGIQLSCGGPNHGFPRTAPRLVSRSLLVWRPVAEVDVGVPFSSDCLDRPGPDNGARQVWLMIVSSPTGGAVHSLFCLAAQQH